MYRLWLKPNKWIRFCDANEFGLIYKYRTFIYYITRTSYLLTFYYFTFFLELIIFFPNRVFLSLDLFYC